MALDLATAYTKCNLEQTPENDVKVTDALNISIAVVENFLDRKFTFDSQAESFYYNRYEDYPLDRYPVENISEILADGNALNIKHKIHRETGILKLDHHVFNRELKIVYTGGYRVLPADLEAAVWSTFQRYIGWETNGGGESQPIDSVTIQDVGTVRFSSPESAISASNNLQSGALPESAVYLLTPYRRISA